MITEEERAKLKVGDVVYYASEYQAKPIVTKVEKNACGNLAFSGFNYFKLFDDLDCIDWIDYSLSEKECIKRIKEKMLDYRHTMLLRMGFMQKTIEEINRNLESLENGD